MAADLAADLVVMVALGSDLQRVACVCRAWSDALADLPRFIYDPRGRTPMLDAARACARDYYARRMTAPFIHLLRGMGGMRERPWAIKWRLALRVPNARGGCEATCGGFPIGRSTGCCGPCFAGCRAQSLECPSGPSRSDSSRRSITR
jgi:hypothetical protein